MIGFNTDYTRMSDEHSLFTSVAADEFCRIAGTLLEWFTVTVALVLRCNGCVGSPSTAAPVLPSI
jgi:hypothetical protein